jgi:transglutaminase-like putative cysteine protease
MAIESTLYLATQLFEYEYPEPVRAVCTELRLSPPSRRGGQHLRRRECRVLPCAEEATGRRDVFGNEVREFRHGRVERRLRFEVHLLVETAEATAAGYLSAEQGVPVGDAEIFLRPTPLTDHAPTIRAAARELREARLPGWRQVASVGRWVYETMKYRPGATEVDTTASRALELRQGVCQDYAHVMLAICRCLGMPARYVSGFIPGEGYMHAWVEVLAPHPESGDPCWQGYDPTHCRRVDSAYIAVAAGRDFADVSPVSGTFIGAAPGRLTSWCEMVPVRPVGRTARDGSDQGEDVAGVRRTAFATTLRVPAISPVSSVSMIR